jgi:hypothetical protein
MIAQSSLENKIRRIQQELSWDKGNYLRYCKKLFWKIEISVAANQVSLESERKLSENQKPHS